MTSKQSAMYKKFIIGAASAALVASAVAPVASAKDFNDTKGNTHEPAIDALSDAGVITGYPDGSFLPNKTMTRSDVVKLMGKWLVSEGYKVPTDYKTKMRFDDLKTTSNDELLQYAAVVKDNGVFNGSNGNLLAGDNITRENMAVVIVRAFDQVKDMDLVTYVAAQDFKKDVTDLAKAKAEARTAIDVLDFFDITNPAAPAFNPKNTTTRGQFATFLHKTVNTDFSAVKAPEVDENQVTVDAAAEQVKAGAVTVARGNYATDANKLAAVQTYVTSLVTEKDVVATVVAGKTAGEFAVTLTKGEAKAEKTIAMTFDFAADDRFVTEVNALNATQVEVKFSAAVDASDIADRVTIQGVTFTAQSLSEDGKVLSLTAKEAINVTKATVVVEPIKTKADAKVKTDKYVSTITYKDEVAPTIASVEAKTGGNVATSLTLKTSEPIKATGLVKVNGTYVTPVFTDASTISVSGLALEAGKTHTIELVNIEDMAGNKTVTTSANFTVNVDATVPAVTLATKGEKQILVTFSKSMDVKSVKDALVSGTVKDEALNNVETGAVTVVEGSNDTQFLIPVTANNVFTIKASRMFTVVLTDANKDKLGNKITATTQNVTLTKDSVKPVATGYKVIKDNDGKVTSVEVNFSEGLAAGTPALPTIVSENGVAVSDFLGGFTTTVKAGDTKVVYTAKTPAPVSGKFALSFAKELVTDQAETANKSDAFNYTIDFGQAETATTFELTSANAVKNVITVTFPEAVKGGAVANSATDLANYSLAGKPLAAGTTITLDNAQKVATITLPAESVEKTDQAAVFTVANIQSTSGKTLKTYTKTVGVEDNVAPVLLSAKVLDDKSIELTYSENVDLNGSEVGADFTLIQGSTAINLDAKELLASKVSGFPTKIKITIDKTLADGAPTTLDITKDITVETKLSAVVIDKEATPNTQKVGVKVTATKQ
ncbi:S-layer homology domain-containing protein [Sporosarcina sp. E16_3]|uniref:S-layer homology domain-containing protein n=1 Tax=Sporosarcina sp. E16_3 TaxID=2789293 RepID=UPI001A92FB73|nr:S-layer homology domain-containing protein [Sporosarcina sp. E16_3]MBO0603167.1 S-layer homology domain-containing protein [Sporosarcina sp. E16_3]